MVWYRCPLLAQSGHSKLHRTCPLSGVKRTSVSALQMSAFDPKRTCAARKNRGDFCPLLVASPYLVTDFLGDHSIADMEIVQQSHLHLGADGERAILEAITRDAKRRPHVVEDAVGRCERSEEHTSELQSLRHLVCRLL